MHSGATCEEVLWERCIRGFALVLLVFAAALGQFNERIGDPR